MGSTYENTVKKAHENTLKHSQFMAHEMTDYRL